MEYWVLSSLCPLSHFLVNDSVGIARGSQAKVRGSIPTSSVFHLILRDSSGTFYASRILLRIARSCAGCVWKSLWLATPSQTLIGHRRAMFGFFLSLWAPVCLIELLFSVHVQLAFLLVTMQPKSSVHINLCQSYYTFDFSASRFAPALSLVKSNTLEVY